ncbi:MAG: CcoQ/FixQ family Cbb3-type cytochrome c oxidase assembly chaperone [Sutterellaceae bacterium]|nr:CcoQ/FixQ family Cbb3-type cytochrome c oxidase assembly chaperone [Burkholderiaceae bacterium]MDW8429559.1 CcoQ/FixQ family Cbb3-type cytochrome c oxidase assembly chaperone [Sutterellaceae bacterium]
MDINTVRSVLTVVFFVLFVGVVWWAYRRGSCKDFEEAQQLPFADTELPGSVDPRGETR